MFPIRADVSLPPAIEKSLGNDKGQSTLIHHDDKISNNERSSQGRAEVPTPPNVWGGGLREAGLRPKKDKKKRKKEKKKKKKKRKKKEEKEGKLI